MIAWRPFPRKRRVSQLPCIGSILCALVLACTAGRGQTVDDFSAGGWERSRDTPGTLVARPGELLLIESAEGPDWVMAHKVFDVDLDRTPWFVAKVAAASTRADLKLTWRRTRDKREPFRMDQPGLYAINVREKFGWSGRGQIETALYAVGERSEVRFEFVKYASALTLDETRLIEERTGRRMDGRLCTEPFELVPLFNSCSYYFTSPPRPDLAVQFRERDASEWHKAYPPVHFAADGMYRGSVVRLEEDTSYELRIIESGGKVLAQNEFRTWRSDVPVAETIVLDESNFGGSLRITRSGTPDGWIRYVAKDGFILRNDRSGPLIELLGARHVILEGLTLRGGLQTAVRVQNCRHVRIINCDIAGWGRRGKQRFDLNGAFYTADGRQINWDTGIVINRSFGTVVERCYIHDPVTTANSWYYAHPAGPQAVGIAKPQSTVLRHNDFVGSDAHRWNDATEGEGNFHSDGGFNRDADIYGNFACFANDDAIEIDGGQTNVRVFDNWYEGCLCGVSIQGCMSGPSYVFDNLMVNMGDERGLAGQTIKTSSNESGPGAVSFIFGNTTFGLSHDLGLLDHLRIVARNNLFAGRSNITGRDKSPRSDCDYNLQAAGEPGSEPHGVVGDPGFLDPAAGLYGLREDSRARRRGQPLDNFTEHRDSGVDIGAIPSCSGRALPLRPIPVELDRSQLQFSAAETAVAAEKSVTATISEDNFRSEYRIVQNDAFDWFTVTPERGKLESGRAQTFAIKLRPGHMRARPLYRGAFLIRLANGYSRPVMVYAATGYRQPMKPARDGAWSQFQEAESPANETALRIVADPMASGGRALLLARSSKARPVEYRFETPRAGKYFVVLRLRCVRRTMRQGTVMFGIDEGPIASAKLRVSTDWAWCLAAQNRSMSLICLQAFDLSAGEHLVKLAPRESVQVDLVALTDDPALFE